jgi:hypothetical protein
MDSKPQYSRAPAAFSIAKRSRISKASYGGIQVIVDYRESLARAYIVQPVNTRIYHALILPSCFAGLALWLFTTICNSRLPIEKPGVYRQTSSGARVLTAAMVLYMIMVLLICWAITDGTEPFPIQYPKASF